MNRSINRSITQICVIICFIICLSSFVTPVESQRKPRRTSNVLSKPIIDQSDEVFTDKSISQSINQSNDQSVELQPAQQSPLPVEAPELPIKRSSRKSRVPAVEPPTELPTQSNEATNIAEPTASEQLTSRDDQLEGEKKRVVEVPSEKKRVVEVPSSPVKRARDSIYRASKPKVALHQHSPDEDLPVGKLDAEPMVDAPVKPSFSRDDSTPSEAIGGSIHSGHSDHATEQTEQATESQPSEAIRGSIHSGHSDHATEQTEQATESQSSDQLASKQSSDEVSTNTECLTENSIATMKQKAKADLKSIMSHFQSIWSLEGKSEESIKELVDQKSKELVGVFRAKKAELAKRACSSVRSVVQSNGQSDEQLAGLKKASPRSLYDQLSKASSDEASAVKTGDEKSAPSDLMPGGVARRLLSIDEISLIETEDDEVDDDRVYTSSIHPYREPEAPSAFTELSERDIASRHESVDEIVDDDDDDFRPGFRATITPTRLSDDELSTLALRSVHEIEEEIAEEKVRRLARLKARRGIIVASILHVSEPSTHSEEQQHPIGHYVASIKPQHSSPIFEEDVMTQAYQSKSFKAVKAGITASDKPSAKIEAAPKPKVEREWMKAQPTSSRSRLARMVRTARDE